MVSQSSSSSSAAAEAARARPEPEAEPEEVTEASESSDEVLSSLPNKPSNNPFLEEEEADEDEAELSEVSSSGVFWDTGADV